MDTKPLPGPCGRRWYQYTAIDDCTRWRVLRLSEDLSISRSLPCLDAVVRKMPFAVRALRTDRGAEFTHGPLDREHPFTLACRARGIQHILNPRKTPEANGKVERSHRTDDEEFYRVTPRPEWRARQPAWQAYYNTPRRPQGLHGLTPLQKLQRVQRPGGVTDVRV